MSPNRISDVATVSFSLITGTAPKGQELLQGRARVQMAAPLLGVLGGQRVCATEMPCAPSASR